MAKKTTKNTTVKAKHEHPKGASAHAIAQCKAMMAKDPSLIVVAGERAAVVIGHKGRKTMKHAPKPEAKKARKSRKAKAATKGSTKK